MAVKRIYRTDDNKEFNTEQDAIQHEREVKLKELTDRNPEFADLLEYLDGARSWYKKGRASKRETLTNLLLEAIQNREAGKLGDNDKDEDEDDDDDEDEDEI